MFKNILQFFSIPAFQLLIALMLVCFIHSSFSDPVCKVKYKYDLTDLRDKNIFVDRRMVALSSEIKVRSIFKPVILKSHAAIFVIIDNSASMLWQNDTAGLRFKIAKDLIDSIRLKYDSLAEIGVAVFQRCLFFRPDLNTVLQQSSKDSGAYIPLLNLTKTYPPNGYSGYGILKYYLDTTLKTKLNTHYVDLKYKPTPAWPDSANPESNINAGFNAAKEAFTASLHPKNRHFIIFLTDGNVTWPQDSSKNYFIQGINVPTTFTVFFTNSTTPPQNLYTMTNNIKANAYSIKNPSSNLWSSKTDYPTLMKSLLDLILETISTCIYAKPESLFVNGVKSINYDSVAGQFVYSSLFPLIGFKTDYTYKIFYKFRNNIIGNDTFPSDTTIQSNFSITVQNGAITPDTFEVKCWDRELGFYYENNKVTTANKAMKTLEIRFSSDSGVAKYWYTNVKVEVTGTTAKDKETFVLTKAGSYYSYVFPLNNALSSTPNNGILEIADIDTLSATFRNAETPQLPLDTLNIAIPYNASSGINPNTVVADRLFQFHIKKALRGKAVIVLKNLPIAGEIEIYTARGQCVLRKTLARGNAVLRFPAFKSSALYIFNLKYSATIINIKVIIP